MKLRLTITVPNWLDRIFSWPVLEYRRWRFGYPFRRIRLTEGKYAIVDQQYFYELNKFDWILKKGRKRFYAIRFLNLDKGTKFQYMHRQIMNNPVGSIVDHKNLDGLNNRIDNLRLATNSQNIYNRCVNKAGCSSIYRGVSWDKRNKHWRAQIYYQDKCIFLGYFDSEIDAAKAYDAAALKYYGEFARLNFPEEAPVS